jgi:serine/threonine-protein kinase
VIPKTLGRYEIESLIGEGGMGRVYKARDPAIGRTVAIKTLNVDLEPAQFEEFKQRFFREARTAGRLQHSNVVTIYDVGEQDGLAYITMEYVEGKTLREVMDAESPLKVDTACRIAAEVAAGLAVAHRQGVVHRDVKPSNIMVGPGGTVKLMDFGIARLPEGMRTRTGLVLGSPTYIAPEQIVGVPVDGRYDLFSLGIVLYEMLTGAVPFRGNGVGELLFNVLNYIHAPPSLHNSRVPAVFERILARALAKHPDDRYASIDGFAHDLREWRNLPRPTAEELAEYRKPPKRTLDRRTAKRD